MSADADLALVTGASSGIGFELARQFVDHGYDVVVVAEDEELQQAAEELRRSGREVVPVRADLTVAAEVEQVWREVERLGRPLAAAALNAGTAVAGRFAETSLEDHQGLVDLNVRSTVHLGKRVVDHMVAQGRGRILITASIVAVAPAPFQPTYAASKAFVHSFAEAIRHELKGTGVTVTSLMPGPTDTELFARADMEDSPLARGRKDDPATVAKDGFEGMMKGKPHVRAGSVLNAMMVETATHLSDRVTSALVALQTKRKRD
ncbi:SDR family NAD(P)-dependent oxidoreductase [Nocardioides sp. SYSU DS0651]|uniref:SDR family NAD(P)-dependent oxidoreductase n=1 Tax=Nocardioides sp. SYSU DS0651 TaxID=3415955 RepID=UPI003F4C0A4D